MSRRHHEENTFGSDSFLDVIANIVGILIILIVVAGVRVSQAPLLAIKTLDSDTNLTSTTEPTTTEQNATLPVTTDLTPEPVLITLLPTESTTDDPPLVAEFYNDTSEPEEITPTPVAQVEPEIPDFVPPTERPLPEIPAVQVDQKVVDRIAALERSKVVTSREISQLESQFSRLEPDKKSALEELQKTIDTETKTARELQLRLRLIAADQAENSNSQKQIDQLNDQIKQIQETEAKTKVLSHKLNPVGRVVSGKEVHFCLHGSEVSYVPIKELSELVKKDMQRRRDFLLKQQRFQSTVGPVNGFEMEYLVQRESSTLLNEVRFGNGMIRVAVTDWVLRPTGDIVSESLERAVLPNSQFRSALVSEGTNATITFWVYPDSFDLHRELKQLVHDSGFWVASRPLPAGFPIAGSSTSGSKSIAQ